MSQGITVKILLFAAARDAAETAEINVLLSEPSPVSVALEKAAESNPGLAQFLKTHFLIAVDEEFAELSTVLSRSCELAVLPPVSGG